MPATGRLRVLVGLLLATRLAAPPSLAARQNSPPEVGTVTYNLSVAVDEVALTFHATDANGLPDNTLTLKQLKLLDNGSPPRRIVAFELLQDGPTRAGILIDTSSSMREHLTASRAIATRYAQSLAGRPTAQAFLLQFGRLSTLVQPWTSSPGALVTAIARTTPQREGRLAGTAIFDTLYHACLSQFGPANHAASRNAILLFSDGEDTGSYLPLEKAVDMCQRADTVIYAFRPQTPPETTSTGPATLAELARQTGGRVFLESSSDADLHTFEADLQSRYRLVYQPLALKHDGAFHQLTLEAPERFTSITVRSGYYAPAK